MIEDKNGKNRFFLKWVVKIFDFRLFSFKKKKNCFIL